MAASTVSSSIVTNRLATPPTYNNPAEQGSGEAKRLAGSVAVATTSIDETSDVIILCEVPGHARITSIKLFNDDLDSNGSPTLVVDLGIFKDVDAAGTSATVVDADAYMDGSAAGDTTLQAANTAGVEMAFKTRNINVMGQTVAEDGGESVHNDPRYLGLTVTAVAATAAAGDISWVVEYVL